MIIGLSGKALSGKDTTADYLVDYYGFDSKVGFATNLKEMVVEVFGLTYDDVNDQVLKARQFKHRITISEGYINNLVLWVNKTHNVENVDFTSFLGKVLSTPREVLQFVGTDFVRSICSSYHVDVIRKKVLSTNNLVITDVRFRNEVDFIKDLYGMVVRLNRNVYMVGGRKGHPSETSLDDFSGWDYVLNNNGSIENLYSKIDTMMISIKERRNASGRRAFCKETC